MRVAVTGAAGRLGRALVSALEDAPYTGPFGPVAWTRAEFDLDHPEAIHELIERDRPEAIVHAAAWTDVDGCAREPELAMARNGRATGMLAEACARRNMDLVILSTNEVFDGGRTDGHGYSPTDAPSPANAYGASKLEAEILASAAFPASPAGRPSTPGPQLGVVRTAWLFGPGKPDFPAKILAAAVRARSSGEPLRAVSDEWASPTYVADLAEAIVDLIGSGAFAGIHHVVNAGVASRADWARDVLARAGVAVPVEEVPSSTWTRASTPPRWGVLDPTPLPSGEPLRPWREAMADYAPTLLREHARPPR